MAEPGILRSPFHRRVWSGLVLGPPVLLAVWVGTPAFEVLIIAAMAVLAWEWSRLFDAAPPQPTGVVLIVGLVAAIGLDAVFGPRIGIAMLIAAIVLVLAVSRRPWLAAGGVYFGVSGLVLIGLRADPDCGRLTVFWLLAIVWASDIGAYLAGSALGGPKLAPSISPNKTWSGFAGGLAAAALAGTAVGALAPGAGTAARLALIGAGVGLATQAGDLGELLVKRHFGVKDTSGLIPGHGGLLDRVDGLLAATLVTALIVAWLGGSICRWL